MSASVVERGHNDLTSAPPAKVTSGILVTRAKVGNSSYRARCRCLILSPTLIRAGGKYTGSKVTTRQAVFEEWRRCRAVLGKVDLNAIIAEL